MNPLPLLATTSDPSNIADFFTKHLPPTTRHRLVSLIGAGPTVDTLASATPTATAVPPTVAPTVVASASASVPTPTSVGPTLAPTLPIVLDTGASFSIIPFASDFIQAPFGLIRSAASVTSKSKVASIASVSTPTTSTPVDPYTLITGEDTAIIDLSSRDLFDLDSDSVVEFASTSTQFREFGTATLVFYYSGFTLIHISVEPDLDRFDWLHWVPLPRLILSESYFHIFGLDYSQAFALFHLIPIWIALVFALLRSE